VETTLGRAVIVGIGINLNKESFSDELTPTATSVESVTGARPDRDQLLDVLLQTFSRRYEVLQGAGGEAATVRHWSKLSTFAENRRVRVENSGQSIEGITRGLELDGALRLETDDGQIHLVRAGDVTAVRPAIENSRNASS
jgi:BirA family biotin operon repressor/biotin-[acetyl-CoA-carboxylase] ligase